MMCFIPFRAAYQTSFVCIVMAISMTVQSAASANPPVSIPTVLSSAAAESNSPSETRSTESSARKKKKSSPGDWTHSPARPEPARSGSVRVSSLAPIIRFISASGAEDGKTEAAALTDAVPDDQTTSPDKSDSMPKPSLSIKQQLLNAINAQREVTVLEAESDREPGSLTILHSPQVPQSIGSPAPGKETEPPAATQPESPPPTKTRVGLTRTLEEDLKSTDPYVRDRAQRYLRLEMQLLKLRANQAARAEHALEASMPQVDPQHADQPTATVPQDAVDAELVIPPVPAAEIHGHDAATSSAEDSHTAIQQDHAPQALAEHADTQITANHDAGQVEHSSSPHSALPDNTVVDGPIDRLGLANNLFAVGEYPLALEMYQQTDVKSLTSHQHFWVEYQTANCLRRLGKGAEASIRYRRLAEQPEAGWLSQQASWWVETLEKIRILEKTLAEHALDSHAPAVDHSNLEEPKHDESSH